MLLTTKKSVSCGIEELTTMVNCHALFVGDELSINLTDGTSATLVVIGYPEDGNGVVFNFKDCIDEHRMNPTWTNEGGYFESEMRQYLERDILPLIPKEFAAHIVPRTISQKHRGKTYTMTDKLWLLSEEEVHGKTVWSGSNGETQYPYFADRPNRVKTYENDAAWWWVRSPYRDGSSVFCGVGVGGDAGNGLASRSHGVAPAFIFN